MTRTVTCPDDPENFLGSVDLLLKPEESTNKVEKAQEVSGQFIKTRKYSHFY